METKRSKKKFLGIPMPGILNLKRSDTSTSCPTDGEQDSAPSSQVRSAAASSRQTDEPDTKSVLDSNPPTAILIDNPLERESTCQPDPDRPPETDQLFVSSSRPGTPSDHQLQELPDLLAASTPTVHPATAQRDSNNGLWGEAYTNLRGKVKEVASQYEDDISLYLGNVTGVDSLSTPELTQHEMVALSNQVIKRWLGEWDTCDEELSAEQVLETIKEVKEAIERSLERNPDAIIAWGALPLTIKVRATK